jgi:hypothetical protein
MIRNKGFLRVPLGRYWTIGYDLRNRIILQFVRTVPYTGQHYHYLNLFLLRIVSQVRNVAREEWRTFINFGWGA